MKRLVFVELMRENSLDRKCYTVFVIVYFLLIYVPVFLFSASGWHISRIEETSHDVGQYCDSVIDNLGVTHISYYDLTESCLKYAKVSGTTTLKIEVVDDDGDVGGYTSIAISTYNTPVISYYDFTKSQLKCAIYVSTYWVTTAVDTSPGAGYYTSVKCAPDGKIYISYYNHQTQSLMLAMYVSQVQQWQIETVDSGNNDLGRYSSLCIDRLGNPHIAYHDSTLFVLKYASFTASSGWSISTVDASSSVGMYCSLTLTDEGSPMISYYDRNLGNLKLAKYTPSMGWKMENVDVEGNVGQHTSIGGYKDKIYISYYDVEAKDLKLALHTGNVWVIREIDTSGDVGIYSSLNIDACGVVKIVYYDTTNRNLKLAQSILPVSQITYPKAGHEYAFLGTISGTAHDFSGYNVSYVKLKIRDTFSNTYWSGSKWVAEECWLTAEGTELWYYSAVQAGLNWVDGRTYEVFSKAVNSLNEEECAINSVSFTFTVPSADSTAYPLFGYDISRTGRAKSSASTYIVKGGQFFVGNYLYSTPVVSREGNLIFTSSNGKLYILSHTNKLLWEYTILQTATTALLYTPVLAHPGVVYVPVDDKLMCIDIYTKTLLWEVALHEKITAEIDIDSSGIIYVPCGNKIYKLAPVVGSVIQTLTLPERCISAISVDAHGNIYIPCANNRLYVYTPKGDIKFIFNLGAGEQISNFAVIDSERDRCYFTGTRKLYCYNTINGNLEWYVEFESEILSPVAINTFGEVIVCTEDNRVYAVDDTGRLLWSSTALCGRVLFQPAVDVEGKIYLPCENMYLYILSREGKLLNKVHVGSEVKSQVVVISSSTLCLLSNNGVLIYSSDNTPPVASITVPHTGLTYNHLSCIKGNAQDDSGEVAAVEVSIKNLTTGKYWDGEVWISTSAELYLRVYGTSSWYYPAPPETALEDGAVYAISASAVDCAGNRQSTPATVTFAYTKQPLRIQISGIPSPVLVGTPISFTVEIIDVVNNVICSSYTGTIVFYTDDELATLPVNYTFSPADKGRKNFSNALIFRTPGIHYVKIYDKNEPTAIYGLSVGIKVVDLGISSSWVGSPHLLPAELANFGLLTYNDDIYIFGGRGKNEIQNTIYKSNFGSEGEFGLLSWSLIGYLPKQLHGHAVVNYQNIVYILGGWTTETALSQDIYMAQISTYSIKMDDWKRLETALPRPLGDFVAISTGNVIYLLGGRDGINNVLSDVWVATISTTNYTISRWYKISELPERLYGATGVLLSEYIYIIGGRMANKQTSNKIYRAKLLHDMTLSAWENVGEMPQGLYKHSTVVYKRQLYILGGWSSYTNTALNSVYYAAVDTNGVLGTFYSTAPLPEPRYGHGSAAVKERIYTIGGWGTIMQNVDVDTGTVYPVNSVYYIPASAMPSIASYRDFSLRILGVPNIVPVGQKISFKVEIVDRNLTPVHGYLGTVKFISSDGGAILPETYTFAIDDAGSKMFTGAFFSCGAHFLRVEDVSDPSFYDEVSFKVVAQTTATITSFVPNPATLPSSVAEHSVVVTTRGIYIIGGVKEKDTYAIFFSTGAPYLENYSMTWTTIAVLPSESVGFIESAVVVVSVGEVDRIYIIGGRDMENIYCDVWYAEINDDGTLSSWVRATATTGGSGAAALPTPLYRHAAAVYNNYIYVVGGIDEKGKVHSDVKYMDVSVSTTEWRSTYPLPVGLYDHSVVVTNDGWIYVLGGRDRDAVYDTVYYAKINSGGKLYTSWRTTTPLPEKLYNHVSIVYDDRIYVIGGKNSDNIPQKKIYFSTINPDHTLSDWSEIYSLPVPLEGHAGVVYKDNIYIIGGYSGVGISSMTYVASGVKVDTVPPMPPENVRAVQLKGRKVRLEWLLSPSADVSEYRIYCSTSISELSSTPPIGIVPHGTTFYITMPLLQGYVTYYFVVRAVDKSGNEELNNNIVTAVPVDTLLSVKAAIKTPHNGKRINGNSVTVMAEVVFGKIGDVREIFFEYKAADSDTWMLIPPAGLHCTNPDNTFPYFLHWDVSTLPEGFYNLRAVAVSKDNYRDSAPGYITVVIDKAYCDSEEHVNDRGEHVYREKVRRGKDTVVSVASSKYDNTTVEIFISSGALISAEDELIVTISPTDVPEKSKDVTTTVQDYKITLKESKNKITGDAKLTISYPENISIEEKYLSVIVYEVHKGGRWEEVKFMQKDLDENNITFYSPIVGYFSLVSLVGENVNNYIIYPNPYMPHLYGDTGITFSRLPPETKIEVYTLAGELVWEVTGVSGKKVWFPEDTISSGMYIVIISDSKGNRSVNKIVIVR